jgi:hypothetical protein
MKKVAPKGRSFARGAYVMADATSGPPEIILIASGSEVSLVVEAHEARTAVAADRIDVVIEDIEAGLVVAAGKPLARDRHADAGGDPLTERTGRRLDPRHPVIFRVPRRFAVEQPETADLVEPLGQFADRIVAFLRERREDHQALLLWRERNRHFLREFWARAPADALGVKQEFEKALAQNSKPTT